MRPMFNCIASVTTDGGSTNPLTAMQFLAASNHRITVHAITIGGRGSDSASVPALIRWCTQTSAGTGGNSVTPVPLRSYDPEAFQGTVQSGKWSTTEPTITANTTHNLGVCHEQAGWTIIFPETERLVVPGGQRRGLLIATGSLTETFAINVLISE